MKLSTPEEYGLRCLIQIARKGPGGSMTIPELAEAEGFTIHQVGKLMRVIRRGGFVKSVRGQSGGYALARPARDILLSDLFSALGGRIFDASFCAKHAGSLDHSCFHTTDCSVRALLNSLQKAVDSVLMRLSLQDLLVSEQAFQAFTVDERPRQVTVT